MKFIWKLFGFKESQTDYNHLMSKLNVISDSTLKLFTSQPSDVFFLFEEDYWKATELLRRVRRFSFIENKVKITDIDFVIKNYNDLVNALKLTYVHHGSNANELKKISKNLKPILESIKKAKK